MTKWNQFVVSIIASLLSVGAHADHWTGPSNARTAAQLMANNVASFHDMLHELEQIPEVQSDFRKLQLIGNLDNYTDRLLDVSGRVVRECTDRSIYGNVFRVFSPIREDFKRLREAIKAYLPAIRELFGQYLSNKYGIWELEYRWIKVAFAYEKLEYSMTEGDAIGEIGGHDDHSDHNHR